MLIIIQPRLNLGLAVFRVSIVSCSMVKDFIVFLLTMHGCRCCCYRLHDHNQVRSDKAEEEVAELMKKAEQLEVELDKTKEELVSIIMII